MFTTIIDNLFADDYSLHEVVKHDNRLYDYVNCNSDTLFITIGDSWTYGYRLDGEGDRVELSYGNIISKRVGCDYFNLSIPAINNTWMVDKFIQLANANLGYKDVYVFICLTEFGRELNTEFDMDPQIHDLYRQSKSCKDVAPCLAQYNSSRLLKNLKSNVHLMLGCNYISNLYPTDLQKYFLPMSWLEVLTKSKIKDECYVVGSWVIPKYKEVLSLYDLLSSNEILDQTTELMEIANQRLNLIYNTGFNHKVGYGHPNSQGHKLWADYIVEHFKLDSKVKYD